MKPAQYQQPQYQEVGGKALPQTVRVFQGLNGFDPLSIEDSYLTEMTNMSSDDYPSVSTRAGYSLIGKFGTGEVLGMGTYLNQEVHAIFSDGVWRKYRIQGSTINWTVVASGLSTNVKYDFTGYQGNLVVSNGSDSLRVYNGTSVSFLAGSPAGKFVTTYQNRLWVVSGDELLACAVDSPTVWDRFNGGAGDSYGRQIETPRNEPVTMLYAASDRLLIASEKSFSELAGTDPTNFTVSLVSPEIGASSNRGVTTYGSVTTFISPRGIYEYTGGVLPSRNFSEIIQNFIGIVPDYVCAGTDGTKIYYQISGRILVFDTRSGIQTWSSWANLNVRVFLTFYSPFLNMETIYVGTNDGRIISFDSTTDVGNPISWSVTTKPFNNASNAQKQRWYKMFLVVEFTGSMQVSLSKDATGTSFEQLESYSSSGALETKRVIIPVQKYALENQIRIRISGQGRAKIHEITRQSRTLPLY